MLSFPLLKAFQARLRGTTLRGQIVDGVELIVELNGPEPEPQIFLLAVFRENPPSGESPERDCLERVFSEIPAHARLKCASEHELRAVLMGDVSVPDAAWKLEDE